MKRKLNNNKSFLKRSIIISILLLIWLFLTCIYIITFDSSLSVISYNHSSLKFLKTNNYQKILKGESISGNFTATENYLGIISIKFKTFVRPPYKEEDIINFRFKEIGSNNWYYSSNYRDGLIYDLPQFTFGFPVIKDSKNKIYNFEITSQKGNELNSVALSKRGQVLFSKYQIPKHIIFENVKSIIEFIIKKFISSMLTSDIRFSSFIYILPLFFYLFWTSKLKYLMIDKTISKLSLVNILNNNFKFFLSNTIRYSFLAILVIIILSDIFVFQVANDTVYLVIVFIWIFLLNFYKLSSKITLYFSLILLLFIPIFLLIKDPQTAEKFAVWSYIYFAGGVLHIIINNKLTPIK